MVYRGSYAVVLVLHLLAVVFVVGPLAVAGVHSPRLARTGQVVALRAAARTTRLYAFASVVVVLLGSALVGLSGTRSPRWDMGDLWISGSYAFWLLALVLTLGVVVPAQVRAARALDEGGDAGGFATRMAAGAGLAMLCWVVIVALMVVKPGA